jgi:hypothetical protein
MVWLMAERPRDSHRHQRPGSVRERFESQVLPSFSRVLRQSRQFPFSGLSVFAGERHGSVAVVKRATTR